MIHLLAPTEHQLHDYFRSTNRPFRVSSLPERHGCDIVTITKRGLVGYQRKTLPDLQASLLDGRLYLELSQLNASGGISYGYLIIESPLARTTDGTLLESSLTINQVRSIIVKFAASGIGYIPTASVPDTAEAIGSIGRYLESDSFEHIRRPKNVRNEWGTIQSNSFSLWLLQSFPGIGPKNAKAIYDHFGTVPIAWTVSASELQEIPGIGPVMADKLIKALA